MASISISMPGMAKRLTSMRVLAGLAAPKNALRTLSASTLRSR